MNKRMLILLVVFMCMCCFSGCGEDPFIFDKDGIKQVVVYNGDHTQGYSLRGEAIQEFLKLMEEQEPTETEKQPTPDGESTSVFIVYENGKSFSFFVTPIYESIMTIDDKQYRVNNAAALGFRLLELGKQKGARIS